MKMNQKISKLEQLIEIQSTDGNWNYDEYNYGLLNGLILAKAIITDKEPVYKDKPKVFKSKFKLFKRFKFKGGLNKK